MRNPSLFLFSFVGGHSQKDYLYTVVRKAIKSSRSFFFTEASVESQAGAMCPPLK